MKYERLTKKGKKWIESNHDEVEVYNRLAELEDDLESGKMIRLPCKVGNKVWYIEYEDNGVIWVDKMIVKGFEFSEGNKEIFIVGTYREKTGKIYKTKAEAEKRLKELQGE